MDKVDGIGYPEADSVFHLSDMISTSGNFVFVRVKIHV